MQLLAFMLTLILEGGLAWYVCRRQAIRPWWGVGGILAASVLSHPLAWEMCKRLDPQRVMPGWLVLEAWVTAFEAAVLLALPGLCTRSALLLAVACNGFSAGAGVLLTLMMTPG